MDEETRVQEPDSNRSDLEWFTVVEGIYLAIRKDIWNKLASDAAAIGVTDLRAFVKASIVKELKDLE